MEGFIRFSVSSSRESILLEIFSFFTKLPSIKRGRVTALRERMVLARKANWFCFPSLGKSNEIRFSWWRRIILICAACFNRHFPQGYLRGVPLDTPFVSFLVKGKIPRCGARSSTKKQACWNFALRQSVKIMFWLLLQTDTFAKTKVSLWAYAAHSRGYFSFTRKVSKSVSKRKYPLWYLLGGKSPPQSLRDVPPRLPRKFGASLGVSRGELPAKETDLLKVS